MKRRPVCIFHFVGWVFSLGVHIDVVNPNIELHLPFGFVRVGWEHTYTDDDVSPRTFGWEDGQFLFGAKFNLFEQTKKIPPEV